MQEDEHEKEKEEQHEEKEPQEPEEAEEPQPSKRPKKGVCLVTTEQKKYLKSLILHGPSFRVEVYWTCGQPKCGVRCKQSGKSMFCYSYPSFTVLIELCNEMVQFFEKTPNAKWDRVNYKANSVLMSLRQKYRSELKDTPPLV
ncbi:unnamed protein product [Symbiodinium sp. CCMP2456]|nr:unnamed protein product [Symbiodinium sp. CCMP2456]